MTSPSSPSCSGILRSILNLVLPWTGRGIACPRVLMAAAMALAMAAATELQGQEVRIRDLTIVDREVPVRMVGYGLVVGLDGSGDRMSPGDSGPTVRSVANILRRFDIEVPETALRTRNAAAVLVTAEISPWLRSGGRFEVQVASLGDASSLRGGVLWMTPLTPDVGGDYMATAQGPVLLADRNGSFRSRTGGETSARIPDGGILEVELPRTAVAGDLLVLRSPDLITAVRIADAINAAQGEGTARVEDPGTVRLTLDPAGEDRPIQLARITDLGVLPDAAARIVVDSGNGTVVAGGDLRVGPAVVSHAGFTLAVGGTREPGGGPGALNVEEGAWVQDVTTALHELGAVPREIAAILEGLRQAGALSAEVVVR